MADATDIVIKATDRATGPVRNVANAFRGVEAAARAASAAGATALSKIKAEASGMSDVINKAGSSASGAFKDMFGGLTHGVTVGTLAANAIMGIVGAAKNATLAVLGLVASFARGVVEAAAFAEQSKLAFSLLMHGSANAGQQFERVVALAVKFGLPVEESVKTFQKLLAMQFKPAMAEQLLKMGADLQAIGASTEEVQGALTAISQIKAKGRVQAEELLQLAERGVSTELVITSLGKALGKTNDQVRALMQAGKITADQGIAAIGEAIKIKTGSKNAGDAGEKFAMSTLRGMANVFKAKGAALLIGLGERITKPLVDALGPITKDLMAALDSPEGKAALDSIVAGFTSVLGALKQAWPLVKEFAGGLIEGLAPLKDVGKGFTEAMGPILKVFGVDAKDAASGARLLGQALALVIGAATLTGAVLAGIVTVFVAIPVAIFRAGVAIGEFIAETVAWIAGLPGRIAAFFGNFSSAAMTLGTSIIDGLVNGISAGAARVIEAVKSVATSAITSAATVLKIGSPSKVFEELGGFATEGFERGLQGGTGGVVSASAQMAGGAVGGAAGGMGGLGGGPLTVHMPITIDGAGKNAPEIVDELQRTFMANLASAFRQLQAEAGA